jgi:hypothetical protein
MILVRLTREALHAHRSCAAGVEVFDAIASDGAVEIEWTPLAAVWLAAAYPTYARWLRERGLVPPAYLRDAVLRGADLRGADLRGAYLRRAYLRGADLARADLARADLAGADLRGANLEGANLEGADLEVADLEGADLAGAIVGAGAPAPPGWRVDDAGRLRRGGAA